MFCTTPSPSLHLVPIKALALSTFSHTFFGFNFYKLSNITLSILWLLALLLVLEYMKSWTLYTHHQLDYKVGVLIEGFHFHIILPLKVLSVKRKIDVFVALNCPSIIYFHFFWKHYVNHKPFLSKYFFSSNMQQLNILLLSISI